MIYIDSSVLLAALFSESKAPPRSIWAEKLVSSTLLEYETINRVHAREGDRNAAESLLAGVDLLDLSAARLARALSPFPLPVGTLDGLHLSTMDYLARRGQSLSLASYDKRFVACARALGFAIFDL